MSLNWKWIGGAVLVLALLGYFFNDNRDLRKTRREQSEALTKAAERETKLQTEKEELSKSLSMERNRRKTRREETFADGHKVVEEVEEETERRMEELKRRFESSASSDRQLLTQTQTKLKLLEETVSKARFRQWGLLADVDTNLKGWAGAGYHVQALIFDLGIYASVPVYPSFYPAGRFSLNGRF